MEFIEKYARVDGESENEVSRQSDDDFVVADDEVETSFQDQKPLEYRIKNVTRDMEEAARDTEMWKEFECSDPENCVPECFD